MDNIRTVQLCINKIDLHLYNCDHNRDVNDGLIYVTVSMRGCLTFILSLAISRGVGVIRYYLYVLHDLLQELELFFPQRDCNYNTQV